MAFPYLSALLAIPLIGAIVVFIVKGDRLIKYISIAASAIALLISIAAYASFDSGYSGYQFMEGPYKWIPEAGISYILGVDGLSFPLVVLTTIIAFVAIIYSWGEQHRVNEFFAMLLLMETGLLGVFVSLDFFMFYIFWEVVLIPMYFLIAIWGGPRKDYASIKFFIYTHVAGVIMLLGILAMYFHAASVNGYYTFSMLEISTVPFPLAFQSIVFLALFFGFGVKMPVFPFHTWLPDAHVEAPTAGSVYLAAVMLKMGGYGLIRVAVMMLPDGAKQYTWLLIAIGVISMVYGAMIALAAEDLKRMIALSSVSHMGYVTLGIATMNIYGLSGAMFQMFAHGVISGALFMIAGSTGHIAGTRLINYLGGLAGKLPKFGTVTMVSFLASVGVPSMAGFIAEFLVFTGAFKAFVTESSTYALWIYFGLVTIALTAAYYLWAMQRAMFGPYNERLGAHPHDLPMHEFIPLAILVALMLGFGIWPAPIMNMINTNALKIIAIAGGI